MTHFWRNFREDFAFAMRLRDLARKHEGSADIADVLRAEVVRWAARGKDDRLHVTHDDQSLAA